MAITVVVDGTLISGLLGTESEWAESLDAGPARVMEDKERHYGAAPEDVDALFEQVRTHGFAATAEEQEPSPTACARRCRRSPAVRRTGHRRAHHLPVWRPLEVGRIRVLVAHVGAWWAGGLMPAPDEAEA